MIFKKFRKSQLTALSVQVYYNDDLINKNPQTLINKGFEEMVGAVGFEPPKSETTDLQSAPFGHSGTLPY